MIKDRKGHKWNMRFKHYREGWVWEAQCREYGFGKTSGLTYFKTKAEAEADAIRHIEPVDGVGQAQKAMVRLLKRMCQQ